MVAADTTSSSDKQFFAWRNVFLIQVWNSPAVFEILGSKRIKVMTTFQGYVTSSVTWPFDSPWAFSVVVCNQASISDNFTDIQWCQGECDAMFNMTFNDL